MCLAWLMLQTPVFPNHLQCKTFLKYISIYIGIGICSYVNTTQAGCDLSIIKYLPANWRNVDISGILIGVMPLEVGSARCVNTSGRSFNRINATSPILLTLFSEKSIFIYICHYCHTNNIACLRRELKSCIILTCCIHAQLYRLCQIYSNLLFATSSGHHKPLEGCL